MKRDGGGVTAGISRSREAFLSVTGLIFSWNSWRGQAEIRYVQCGRLA